MSKVANPIQCFQVRFSLEKVLLRNPLLLWNRLWRAMDLWWRHEHVFRDGASHDRSCFFYSSCLLFRIFISTADRIFSPVDTRHFQFERYAHMMWFLERSSSELLWNSKHPKQSKPFTIWLCRWYVRVYKPISQYASNVPFCNALEFSIQSWIMFKDWSTGKCSMALRFNRCRSLETFLRTCVIGWRYCSPILLSTNDDTNENTAFSWPKCLLLTRPLSRLLVWSHFRAAKISLEKSTFTASVLLYL